jgi:site-specific DNA recombinase
MSAVATSRARYVAPVLPHVAAVYTRVSTKRQADEPNKTSLETQEAGCRTLATRDGFPVDNGHIYVDKHSGEELYERPALTALREAAKRHEFAVVYVHSIDRLSRDPVHLGIIISELERLGIAVRFVTEDLDDSPEAQLIRFIKGYGARLENETRKERSIRAKRARAMSGRPIPSNRAPYGYRWADESKSAFTPDPQTAPIVQRIYREYVAGGQTLRAIAAALTAEGIPTPSGRTTRWDMNTVRFLLTRSIYWGEARALMWQQVPVPTPLRSQYVRRARQVERPRDEQVVLPSTVAPALVSPEMGAAVQRRLRLNQQEASRNNHEPEATLLRGGIARCGHCGRGLMVMRSRDKAGEPRRVRYLCRTGKNTRGMVCSCHAIEAHRLDSAVWQAVLRVVNDPAFIEQEIAHMQETEQPGADTLAAIDRQIADLGRRIKNKREYAELVDDARERAEVAAEVSMLRRQQDALEAERVATVAHYADWQRQQEGLERVVEMCRRWRGKLDAMTYDRRRQMLQALKAEVQLYRSDHEPRAEASISLPLSGVLALDLDNPDADASYAKAAVAALR